MNAVLWREMKGQLTAPITAVGHFVVPVFYVVLFAAAFGANFNSISYHGLPFRYTEFFIPGVIAFQTFNLFSWTFSMVRIDRATNIVAVFLTSGVRPYTYFAGKLISSVAITVMRGVIVFAVSLCLSFINPPPVTHLLVALFGLIIGSTIWFALGFICGIFILREDVRDIVFSMLSLPITFASSMYYNLDLAPHWLKVAGQFNPLTYIADTIRCALLGLKIPFFYIFVLVILALLSVGLALRSTRRMR